MIKRTAIAAALAAAFATAPAHAQEDIRAELNALKAEIQRLKSELAEVKQQRAQPAVPAASGAAPIAAGSAAAAAPTVAPVASAPAPQALQSSAGGSGLSFFGYGEISVSQPKDKTRSTADVGRMVLGVGYGFDERTKFVSELEIEHAVSSADDKGEVEVEQAYIEHKLTDDIAAKAGLFLIPLGLLNENHEPPNYYGVKRNFVETAIIPTTWREIGLGFTGNTEAGLRWDAGVTTSFDLTKWSSTDAEAIESPLGSIHQEGQEAKAHDWAAYSALNWNGTPGLNVGGGLFYGGIGQKQPDFAAPDAKLTLFEGHARWTPGDWDLSALYAEGRIHGVEAYNLTQVGNPYPVPRRFNGWYTQAAYKLWESGPRSLYPFARYEQFNTARKYDASLAEFGYSPLPTEKVVTAGLSFKLHPQVVLKADYQWFKEDRTRDVFNIGLGFAY